MPERKTMPRSPQHTVRNASIALLVVCGSASAQACETWDFDYRHYPQGFPQIIQANGLTVGFTPYPRGAHLSGTASFYSPTLKAYIGGTITGTVDHDHISLSVQWSGEHSGGFCPFDFDGCVEQYNGTGVYDGTIDANGNAEGFNWDFDHPNDKYNWYFVDPLKCADPPPPPPPPKPDPMKAAVERRAGGFQPPLPPDPVISALRRPAGSRLPSWSGSGTSTQPASLTTGTFDTDFGMLELSATEGTYSQKNGHVTVTKTNGNIVRGIWEQSTASKPCGDGRFWGKFAFTFDAAGFTGTYGYCKGSPNAGPWNGKRRP
jgi:hypothetical protein